MHIMNAIRWVIRRYRKTIKKPDRGSACRVYSAGGGHGSSFITNALEKKGYKIHIRPDVAFGLDKTLKDYPDQESKKEFHKRSGYMLDHSKNINDNLISYLNYLEEQDEMVMFSRVSRLGAFFTLNKISSVICMVRHPLHAYVSFVGHQHPEAGQGLGSLEAEERISWYANQWNLMTSDYLNSGSKIIRFEYMLDDVTGIASPNLNVLLKDWCPAKRNHGVLDQKKADFLKGIVSGNFYKLYDKWDI